MAHRALLAPRGAAPSARARGLRPLPTCLHSSAGAGGRAAPSLARPGATPLPAAHRGATPRRAGRGALVARAEADFERPSRLAMVISWGLAAQINAAVFCACYESMPALQGLAMRIEEVQPRAVHIAAAKLGTLFASPIDLLLLTIALSLIELMRILAGGDDDDE